MTTATAEQVQQEYQEDIAERVDVWLQKLDAEHQPTGTRVVPYKDWVVCERGLEELQDLAVAATQAAGLEKEAERMSHCGKSYSVARCNQCGEYIGHPYHCNQRPCPTCYYRNLFRFMQRHEKNWEGVTDFTLITVNYGGYRSYDLEEAWTQAYDLHKSLIASFPLLDGGIYHRERRWDEEHHLWNILYHYLLAAHVNYALLFIMALEGEALCEDYRSFEDYASAQSYFIRHCCQYPADILLDYTKVAWYLGLTKQSKLIQGFGLLYRVTGGLNRGAHDRPHRICPICGGKLSFVGLTSKKYVFWDGEHKCYKVDPGAPGL